MKHHTKILSFERRLQIGDEIPDMPDEVFDHADRLRPMNWLWEQIQKTRGTVTDRTGAMLIATQDAITAGGTAAERRALYEKLLAEERV